MWRTFDLRQGIDGWLVRVAVGRMEEERDAGPPMADLALHQVRTFSLGVWPDVVDSPW